MSLFKFIAWFIVGIVGTSFLVSAISNPLVVGVIMGLVIGVLGARD